MHCPFCRHPDSRVVDSREADEGQAIRRRRSCPECGRRFTTVETAVLAVVKRSGVTEPFSREKVISGVRRACQGRDVDDDALNLLAQQVEDVVRAAGSPEVPSNEVGLAILGPLRELDEVAYLGSPRCTARSPRPPISSARSRLCAPIVRSARPTSAGSVQGPRPVADDAAGVESVPQIRRGVLVVDECCFAVTQFNCDALHSRRRPWADHK